MSCLISEILQFLAFCCIYLTYFKLRKIAPFVVRLRYRRQFELITRLRTFAHFLGNLKEYKCTEYTKSIRNVQNLVFVVIFNSWNKFLSKLYFLNHMRKNTNLQRYPHSIYHYHLFWVSIHSILIVLSHISAFKPAISTLWKRTGTDCAFPDKSRETRRA